MGFKVFPKYLKFCVPFCSMLRSFTVSPDPYRRTHPLSHKLLATQEACGLPGGRCLSPHLKSHSRQSAPSSRNSHYHRHVDQAPQRSRSSLTERIFAIDCRKRHCHCPESIQNQNKIINISALLVYKSRHERWGTADWPQAQVSFTDGLSVIQ